MSTYRILCGDVRERLSEIESGSVQTCVTSPPYFGLRDYGHAGQIGLEATPEAFVAAMVSVFAEVGRVLRDDGTLWLNLGDSYAGSGKGGNPDAGKQATNRGSQSVGVLYGKTGESARMAAVTNITRKTREIGCKQKDLIGIPWMVAFALRSAGWYLRADVIWSKPNPMPESVTDRPTKAHEYVFLLSKSARYYYNAAAIAEPTSTSMLTQVAQGYDGLGLKDYAAAGVQNPSTVKARIIANARRKQKIGETPGQNPPGYLARGEGRCGDVLARNCRSVWSFATQSYPDAHFATFPEELPTRCILAGSKPGDLVLDPFTGSGTTGAVALKLGRSFVGCELNPAYVELAKKRIGNAAPLFSEAV